MLRRPLRGPRTPLPSTLCLSIAAIPAVLFLLLSCSSLSFPPSVPTPPSSPPSLPSDRRTGHREVPITASTVLPSSSIRQACSATRFPDACERTLSRAPPDPHPTPADLIRLAIDAAAASLRTARSTADSILASAGGDPKLTNAARNCVEFLGLSAYRLEMSSDSETIGTRVKDARAWLSAGLTYQYDCWSALKYVNTTDRIGAAMTFLDSLMVLTSNALAMAFALDRFGGDTGSWRPPQTERDGLDAEPRPWKRSVRPVRFRRGFDGLQPDVVVCKDPAEGCLGSVQEAVDSAPESGSKPFVIRIKEGVYEEIVKVPAAKRNVVFLGDGMGKTVITGSLNVQMVGVSTYNTATVGVNGDGFMANGITFVNAAGSDSHQAVAFRSDSDFSLLENCEFLGHQDTLYAHALRQFYRSCRIQGTIDFIFGNSAAVFHNCTILIASRRLSHVKGERNAVTAHGRTDPSQSTGFVFKDCVINGTHEYMDYFYSKPLIHRNYLGRPWKEYSRTVFLSCCLEALIQPEGWMPWKGDFALKTLYYGEYENFGPGANVSSRVPWSSQIESKNVDMYSVESFVQGSEWI
ncbi:probable pectinesterase/pectinesterase inhibitor 51 [Nymphaea colorata]|nr:probable pectinesterase/pectinesterase inhibitor 51 [Nymphaea colorata]